MGMKVKILPPGVENSKEPEFRAQMPGIAGNGEQRLGSDAEKNIVNRFPVIESESGNLFRHGEDDVEILDGQKLRLACFEPLGASQRLALGTMPVATRVVADTRMTALAAFVNMTALGCRAAGHDGVDGPALLARKRMLPRKTGLPKNVGQFNGWPGHGDGSALGLAPRLLAETRVESIERTLRLADQLRRNVRVACGGVDAAMAKQHLNDPEVGAVFEQVDRINFTGMPR